MGSQENVDAAVKKLRDKGIEATGLVCHVSNAQQRKDLVKNTIEVIYINVIVYGLDQFSVSSSLRYLLP